MVNDEINLINKSGMMNFHNKIFSCLFVSLSLFSCSNDNETESSEVIPGTYQRTVILQAESDENPSSSIEGGRFTDVYNAEYVYIHTMEDNGSDTYVKIPVEENILACGEDCKGFHLDIEVTETEYLIKGVDGEYVHFSKDAKVYLSSRGDELWQGKTVDQSPLTNSTVLVRDDITDSGSGATGRGGEYGELYRSDDYDISDLVTGNHEVNNAIIMKRKCSAFLVYFLFTNYNTGGSSSSIGDAFYWKLLTETQPEDWSGKIYLGPCFASEYNVETGECKYGENSSTSDGYYASYNQSYTTFTQITYNTGTIEGTDERTFSGYGVETVSTFLVTPYDLAAHEGENMTFYGFLKYKNSNTTSDEGAKYFKYEFSVPVPAYNTTHHFVVICDISELSRFTTSTATTNNLTRCNSTPQEVVIHPAEVIHIQK